MSFQRQGWVDLVTRGWWWGWKRRWQVRNAFEAGYKALIVSNTLPGASKATFQSTVSQHLIWNVQMEIVEQEIKEEIFVAESEHRRFENLGF